MCYPVLIISKTCPKNHITEVTACWRQCDTEAQRSRDSYRWHELCYAHIEPPVRLNNVLPIFSPGYRSNPTPSSQCRACELAESYIDYQDLKQQMLDLETQESEYSQGVESAKASILIAARTLTSPINTAEMVNLRTSEREIRIMLNRCREELSELRQMCDKIYEHYGKQQRNELFQDAIQPGKMWRKRYMAQAGAEERRQQPNYPRFQPELDAEEDPLGIVQF